MTPVVGRSHLAAVLEVSRSLRDAAEDALVACLQYDHWKREIDRLTKEIGGCVCPQEHPDGEPEEHWGGPSGEPSCFAVASKEETDADNWMPGHSSRPLNLDEIEDEVSDCPACSRLCRLIRERKHARQRWGVAKRAVRHVARKAWKAQGGGS